MEERLQKFLASAGLASRRKAEELILAGRVKVNAAVVKTLGTKVDPQRDLVTVDGKLVSAPTERAYYLLYKPPGCVTTASDPEGRPTALDYLGGVKERVFPVGRLDWDAEGAVLFTDDGELAHRLAHPRYGHRRTYLVKVKGDPAPEALRRMVAGVRLEDGPAAALEAAVHEHAERNVWIRVVVGEGRFHLVKRLCEAVGLQVQRLFRPEFGGVSVEGLRSGRFRSLSPAEVRAMKQSVGLAPGEASGPPSRALPKAQRRHGHGPPPAPAARATAPDDQPEEEQRRHDRPEDGDRPQGGPGGGDRRQGRPRPEGRRQGRPRDEERPQGRPAGGDRRQDRPQDEGRRRGGPRAEDRRQDRPQDEGRRRGGPRTEDRRQGRPQGAAPARRGPGRGRK